MRRPTFPPPSDLPNDQGPLSSQFCLRGTLQAIPRLRPCCCLSTRGPSFSASATGGRSTPLPSSMPGTLADGNQLTWWKPCLESDMNAAVFDSYGHEDQSHSDPWQTPHARSARTDTGTADHICQSLDCLSLGRERSPSMLSLYVCSANSATINHRSPTGPSTFFTAIRRSGLSIGEFGWHPPSALIICRRANSEL